MVTRTIVTTEANVLCLNLETAEAFNETVTLARTYKDEKSLMKAVSEIINNESQKAVHVVDTTIVETLYGMAEQDFIANAEKLDPRKVKEEAEAESQDVTESGKRGRK